MHHVPLTSNYHVGGIQHTILKKEVYHIPPTCIPFVDGWRRWTAIDPCYFQVNKRVPGFWPMADLTPWALKWGIPKSPWVSILKWSSMTWMISGYPHGLGNLHIKLFLYIYIYPITYPLRLVYSNYILFPLYIHYMEVSWNEGVP